MSIHRTAVVISKNSEVRKGVQLRVFYSLSVTLSCVSNELVVEGESRKQNKENTIWRIDVCARRLEYEIRKLLGVK